MRWYLGLDSARDARDVIPIVPQGLLGMVKVWWRYLTDGGVGATTVTADEIDALSARQIHVLPVWNAVGTPETTAQGIAAAAQAAQAMRSLRRALPVVFADLEYGVPVTSDWLSGWIHGCRQEGVIPGVYANMGASYWLRAWTALGQVLREQLALWTADWLQVRTAPSPDQLGRWAEGWQSCQGRPVQAWQIVGDVAGLFDLDLVDASWADGLWASSTPASREWRVRILGKSIPPPVLDVDGRLYVGVRELAAALGKQVQVDGERRVVDIA